MNNNRKFIKDFKSISNFGLASSEDVSTVNRLTTICCIHRNDCEGIFLINTKVPPQFKTHKAYLFWSLAKVIINLPSWEEYQKRVFGENVRCCKKIEDFSKLYGDILDINNSETNYFVIDVNRFDNDKISNGSNNNNNNENNSNNNNNIDNNNNGPIYNIQINVPYVGEKEKVISDEMLKDLDYDEMFVLIKKLKRMMRDKERIKIFLSEREGEDENRFLRREDEDFLFAMELHKEMNGNEYPKIELRREEEEKVERENEEKSCCICLEDMNNDIYFTDCIHRFHIKCLTNWINEKGQKGTCPICRSSILFGIDKNGKRELK